MTKQTRNQICSAVVGIALGVVSASFYWNIQQEPVHPLIVTTPSKETTISAPEQADPSDTKITTTEPVSHTDSWKLLQTAFATVSALESKDYSTLSALAHKEKGVRFTPFSTVNLENDIVLTKDQILATSSDTTLYSWGVDVNTGKVLSMTIQSYLDTHVAPLSYSKAPNIATDSVILSGNALENISESYPDTRFVDFSFRGIDPELSGQDWSSLKLVFEAGEDAWYLVAVVHSVWTV